jgi:hypothetical protein
MIIPEHLKNYLHLIVPNKLQRKENSFEHKSKALLKKMDRFKLKGRLIKNLLLTLLRASNFSKQKFAKNLRNYMEYKRPT